MDYYKQKHSHKRGGHVIITLYPKKALYKHTSVT